MRALGRVLLVVAAVCLLSPPPSAFSLNNYEANWYYYDECRYLVGERFTSCNGHVFYQDGQQFGAYKQIELVPCEYGVIQHYWYQWNGSEWVSISGPPPTC